MVESDVALGDAPWMFNNQARDMVASPWGLCLAGETGTAVGEGSAAVEALSLEEPSSEMPNCFLGK